MARTTASKTRRTPAKPAAKRGATHAQSAPKPAKAKATAKATPAAPARKEGTRRTHAEKIKLGKQIIARQAHGETANEIATDLQLYPFQVHQLVQLVHVDKGDVPAITAKSEDVLVRKLAAARSKGDEYASWDWLQARSGMNKVRIKKLMDDAGFDTGDVRAARKGEATPKRGRPAKTADRSKASKATETVRTRNRQQVATPAKRGRKPAAAAPVTPAKPVSKRRAADNNRKVAAAGKTKAAAPVAMAKVDKPKTKRTVGRPAVKGQTSKPATRTQAQRRSRRPVNVPKGARPTADPS